jgi:heme-degrading monooxygenase HmoA
MVAALNRPIREHRAMAEPTEPLARTPRPPYYAVIFTSLQSAETDGYAATADRMVELASGQPGFLGFESVRDASGVGITVSYWASPEAIDRWREHASHRIARELGKRRWYDSFRLRVCRVERDQSFDRTAPAGDEPMTLTELTEAYLDGVRLMRESASGLDYEQARARPIAGKWSVLEVVCHVADFELVFAERIKRIIAMHEPRMMSADTNEFAAALAYHDRDLTEELELIACVRGSLARILRTLPESALDRVGLFDDGTTVVRRTMRYWLEYAVEHVRHHAPFIVEKCKALGATGGA